MPPVRAEPSRQIRVERLLQRSPGAYDEERRLAQRWSYHCNRPDLTLQDRAKMQSGPELEVRQCGAKLGQCGANVAPRIANVAPRPANVAPRSANVRLR